MELDLDTVLPFFLPCPIRSEYDTIWVWFLFSFRKAHDTAHSFFSGVGSNRIMLLNKTIFSTVAVCKGEPVKTPHGDKMYMP